MSRPGIRRAIGVLAAAQRSYSGCTAYRENVRDARVALVETGLRAARHHLRRRLARASRVHRGQRRPRPPGARAAARGSPRPRPADLHRAQHPHLDGGALSIRSAPAASAARIADRRRAARTGRSSIRAAAAAPAIPGSSRTSATTSAASARTGLDAVVLCPVGFLCDHVEVLYDLDVEAADTCRESARDGARRGRQCASAFIDALADAVLDVWARYAKWQPLPNLASAS